MTMLDFKNMWPKYTTLNIICTQLPQMGNKYNYGALRYGVASCGMRQKRRNVLHDAAP